jgi:hypothetical protein
MKYKEEINTITSLFAEDFGQMDIEIFNKKPNEKDWSIAEHIEHLITINSSYFPCFDDLLSTNYKVGFIARSKVLANLMGNAVLKSVSVNNPKKQKTFPIWEPSRSNFTMSLLEEFKNHQDILIGYITKLEAADLKKQHIYSPASKKIFYPLATAFHIVVEHEKRHLLHCKNLKAKLESK